MFLRFIHPGVVRIRQWRSGACLFLSAAALLSSARDTAILRRLAGAEIPVLCYHQIRPHRPADQGMAKAITVPPALFTQHLQMLHDSGYQTILPEALYAYYLHGKALPPKPVIISFDDNTASQYREGLAVLNRFGFKGLFFVMTVSIGKPGYMSGAQIRHLVQEGHAIGLHTWNHQRLNLKTPVNWQQQIYQPKQQLEKITGTSVRSFAFPYGIYAEQALPEIQRAGFELGFILDNQASQKWPLLTVRRLMVLSSWDAQSLHRRMKKTFR